MCRYKRWFTLAALPLAALFLFSAVALTSNKLKVASGDTRVLTGPIEAETFLADAYVALRTKLGIGTPLDSIRLGDGEIKAYQRFGVSCPIAPSTTRPCSWCRNATVSMEVHQTGSDLSVWVSVPHRGLDECDAPAAYVWYEYVKDEDQFSVVAHPLLDVPPFPPPDIRDDQLFHLYNSFAWSHGASFGTGVDRVDPGADPPHWSSILNGLDEGARARYLDLHRRMQNLSTQDEAIRMLFSNAPPESVDLTDRAMESWTPVTLRGLVRQAGISGHDFAREHTTDYNDGRDTPHGDLFHGFITFESTDTSWPGQDYDMLVTPDPDVHYLGSWVRGIGEPGLFDLGVEIEHFALEPFNRRPIPAAFRDWDHETRMNWLRLHPQPPREGVVAPPRAGEWAQIVGRWIIDCGHGSFTWQMAAASPPYARLITERLRTRPPYSTPENNYLGSTSEHHTEIHPPELMVPVTYPTSYMAEARVIATGAWAGEPLTFFVAPPPRPNINAVLRYRIKKTDGTDGYDTQVGGALDLTPWPTTNPNHLVGTLRSTDGAPILLYETGMVGMTRQRRIHCTVECWWDTPSASLSGRVTGSGDLSDTVMYYRTAGFPDAVWSRLPVNSSGVFTLAHLELGAYWFRPASPNRDFADVPRRVTVSAGRNVLEPFAAAERTLTLAEWGGVHADAELPPEIFGELNYELLTLETDHAALGVQRNELHYAQNGSLVVHLAGLVRSERDPRAVASRSEAFCDTTRGGGPGCLRIDAGTRRSIGGARYLTLGIPGNGVAGATFVVKLLLLVNGRSYVTDEQTARTNEEGALNIGFHSGSHVEEVSVSIEATDNPFNRWFLPIGHTQDRTVYPGASGDDASRQTYPMFDRLSPASLGLSRLIIPSGRLSPLPENQRPGLKATNVESGLIARINDKRKEGGSIPLQSILSKMGKQKINPVRSRAGMLKNPGLPKVLEDAWLRAKDPKFRGRLGDPLPKAKGENIKLEPKPGIKPAPSGNKKEGKPSSKKDDRSTGAPFTTLPRLFTAANLINAATVQGGELRLVDLASSKDPEAKLLNWSGVSSGDQLTLSIDFPAQASVNIYVSVLRGPQAGSVRVLVNGGELGEPLDLNFQRETTSKLPLGRIELRPGANIITFVAMLQKGSTKTSMSLLDLSLEK